MSKKAAAQIVEAESSDSEQEEMHTINEGEEVLEEKLSHAMNALSPNSIAALHASLTSAASSLDEISTPVAACEVSRGCTALRCTALLCTVPY
ncbi:MAG: hypothetical protein P4L61_01015 [Candidatus Pacebacteria bacterium]|nr:hypothetical protein [Candidatus Paceibacterota bacterium]